MKTLQKALRISFRLQMIVGIIGASYMVGCKKEEPQIPSETINYTCYCESGNFNLKYPDINGNWHDTTITQNNYTLTIKTVTVSIQLSNMK